MKYACGGCERMVEEVDLVEFKPGEAVLCRACAEKKLSTNRPTVVPEATGGIPSRAVAQRELHRPLRWVGAVLVLAALVVAVALFVRNRQRQLGTLEQNLKWFAAHHAFPPADFDPAKSRVGILRGRSLLEAPIFWDANKGPACIVFFDQERRVRGVVFHPLPAPGTNQLKLKSSRYQISKAELEVDNGAWSLASSYFLEKTGLRMWAWEDEAESWDWAKAERSQWLRLAEDHKYDPEKVTVTRLIDRYGLHCEMVITELKKDQGGYWGPWLDLIVIMRDGSW